MALRWTGGAGSRYIRTTGIPALDSWSASLWFRITTLTSGGSDLNTLIRLGDVSGNTFYELCESGSKIKVYDGSHNAGTSTIITNTWYHAAIVAANIAGARHLTAVFSGVQEVSFDSATTFTPQNFTVGDSQTNDPLSGDIAALKIWNVALSVGEIQNEMLYYMAKRAEGLIGLYPFMASPLGEALVDMSGGAFDWTAQGSAPTIIDGPPINWAPRRRKTIHIPSGGGSPVSVTPGVGAHTYTGFAPTVAVSNNQAVSPGIGQEVKAGFAPTPSSTQNKSATPGVGAHTYAGFAPTPFAADAKSAIPGVGAHSYSGLAPTAGQTQNKEALPGKGDVVFTGFAPTISVSNNQNVSPGIGQETKTGFAPSPVATANTFATPGVGQETKTGFSPSTSNSANKNATPGLGQETKTGFAPNANATANQAATPGKGDVVHTGYAPLAFAGSINSVVPGVGAQSYAGFAPSLAITQNKQATPGAGQLVEVGASPVVAVSDNRNVTPGVGAETKTGFTPSVVVSFNQFVTPGLGSMIFVGFAPTVVGTNIVIRPRPSRIAIVPALETSVLSPLFSEADLLEMRATFGGSLPFDCDIQTDIGTEHNGAHRAEWKPAAKTVKCSFTPIGSNDAQQSDQRQAIGQYLVRFREGTAVTERNRLVVSGTSAGRTFARILIVTGVQAPKAWEASVRCTCRDATAAEL